MKGIDIAARRRVEVDEAAANLLTELEKWQAAASAQLETHQSQIGAARATLASLLGELGTVKPKDAALILQSVYRIWDFYRVKFAQRTDSRLSDFLNVADQLAYDCYEAVGKATAKAPPLVVLTGASQPYVQKRQSPFIVEGVATQEGLAASAIEATAQLPFPVIGLPWSQPALLAGLTVIPHEVGHTVEDDLGLTPTLQTVFESGNARAAHWLRWQRELFADSWGALCCGPAFAFGLADHLAPVKPWREPIDETRVYPPAWLRVRFAFRVVKALWNASPQPWPAHVAARVAEWEAAHLEREDGNPFLDDLDAIHARLLALELPGQGIFQNLPLRFTPEQQGKAERLSGQWLPEPSHLLLEQETSMRVVAAAYRIAWDADPQSVAAKTPVEKVLKDTMLAATHPGLRGAIAVPEDEPKRRGKALFALIAGSLTGYGSE